MLPIRRILVPVNFTEACRAAALFAGDLASTLGADIVLVHVLEPAGSATGFETATVFEASMNAMRDHARATLEGFLADENTPHLRRVLLEGDPASQIIHFAQSEKSDLILMPTHGYGAFRRLLLGSVTAKVLHDSVCPVWTGVHPEAYDAAGRIAIRRVACAVDLGPQTGSAIQWAVRFANHWDAPLDLIHVVAQVPDEPWGERLKHLAKEQLTALQAELGFEAELHVASGDARRLVPETAARLGARLLVIGRGHATHARLGGGAYALIRDAGIPVVSM